jgi:hypothetical protein
MAMAGVVASVIFSFPGFSMSKVAIDVLHALDLGATQEQPLRPRVSHRVGIHAWPQPHTFEFAVRLKLWIDNNPCSSFDLNHFYPLSKQPA